MKRDIIFNLEEPFIHLTFKNWYELKEDLQNNNKLFLITIDGNECLESEGLLLEFCKVFKFPDYFGHNWEALEDCINDLDWLPSDNYTILIKDAHNILKYEYDNFKVLIRILKTASKEWVEGISYSDYPKEKTPFHIIFHNEKEYEEVFKKMIEKLLLDNEYDII
ncbi:barstar family protein [Peptostreptococcaceae bacterium AGR-M142]